MNKVQTFFNYRPLSQVTLAGMESSHSRLLSPSLLWQTEEIDFILSAEKSRVLATARPLNQLNTHQTFILGVDLNSNSLLLDDFFPRLEQPLAATRCSLMLICNGGTLVLQIEIDQKIPLPGGPCLLAKITEKQLVSDRRQHPRTHFFANHMPPVRLLAPMAGEIKGWLQNLSTGGLMMLSHTTHRPSFYTSVAELALDFDDSFSLHAKVQIKSLKFLRKPHRHSVIGALFIDLSEDQKDQIDTFIRVHQHASTTEPD